VYHGQRISKAAISAAEQQLTGQGRNTTYGMSSRQKGGSEHRIWPAGAAAHRSGPGRSGTMSFRIPGEEERDCCRISTKNGELL